MSASLVTFLLELLFAAQTGGCLSQPVRLGDPLATVMTRFGTPSRSEDVAAVDDQPRQVFLEWDRHSEHTVIVVDPIGNDIQAILFTERGARCTMWGGVPVGKATVGELLKLRGKEWMRRHCGCDSAHLRLVFTYPDQPGTTVEYTAFVPKASISTLASELCEQTDETPTDRSNALLTKRVDRLEKAARSTRIRAVALRRSAMESQ